MSRAAEAEKDSYGRKDLKMSVKAKRKESGSLSSREMCIRDRGACKGGALEAGIALIS